MSGLLLVLGLGGACGAGEPAGARSGPPPVPVEVVRVEHGHVDDWVELLGQLESESSVVVKPEIAGVVASIEFIEGQQVRQEDVLVRLRDREQTAALREAEARAKLAEEVYRRTRQLARQSVAAATELDRARAESEVTRAAVEIARVALDRTRIRAPFDGVVGSRRVSPGERVDQDSELVRIDAVDRLQLVSAIPERGAAVPRVGLPVRFQVKPYPGEEFGGEIFFVAPTLDPRNRHLSFKAWIPNPDHRLKPGLFANLRLLVAEREAALVIPESAVVHDQRGPFVWRVSAGEVAERAGIRPGIRQDGRVEVTSGLAAGERIVSSGTHKVSSGARLVWDGAPAPGTLPRSPAPADGP